MTGRLPVIEWNYTLPPGYRMQNLNSVFRHWHRAHLLGLELAHLKTGADKKGAPDLERLNLWICGHGARRCRSLPYWDGFNALDAQVGLTLGSDSDRSLLVLDGL